MIQKVSVLGQVLFNIFANDVLLFINKAELVDFIDNNILHVTSENLRKILDSFQG